VNIVITGTERIMDSLHHINIILTTAGIAFREELFLCCYEWSATVEWDTVPITRGINFDLIVVLHLPYGV
jgi:hypothetical protein